MTSPNAPATVKELAVAVERQRRQQERRHSRLRTFVAAAVTVLSLGLGATAGVTVWSEPDADPCRAATVAARTLNDTWHSWKEATRPAVGATVSSEVNDEMARVAKRVGHAQDAFVELQTACLGQDGGDR